MRHEAAGGFFSKRDTDSDRRTTQRTAKIGKERSPTRVYCALRKCGVFRLLVLFHRTPVSLEVCGLVSFRFVLCFWSPFDLLPPPFCFCPSDATNDAGNTPKGTYPINNQKDCSLPHATTKPSIPVWLQSWMYGRRP